MGQQNHHDNPEIWFRPSPMFPSTVLSKLILNREITATPRMGIRDSSHPKGYNNGQIVTLRMFDDDWKETMNLRVCVKAVRSKRLQDLIEVDLVNTVGYRTGWKSVQQDLSFFEGRVVEMCEMVSLVEFDYI